MSFNQTLFMMGKGFQFSLWSKNSWQWWLRRVALGVAMWRKASAGISDALVHITKSMKAGVSSFFVPSLIAFCGLFPPWLKLWTTAQQLWGRPFLSPSRLTLPLWLTCQRWEGGLLLKLVDENYLLLLSIGSLNWLSRNIVQHCARSSY